MNLIITPVYHAFDRVKELCDTIDNNATMDFLHVLVGDNCGELPVEISSRRITLSFKNDHIPGEHKSREGQALDLAYAFGTQIYTPYGPQPIIDYVFLIESDVMPPPGWDKKQIELSKSLPKDWATLDVNSVDKDGKITYPTAVSPRYGYVDFNGHNFEHQHYPDFQCTLFNPMIWKTGIRFSDYPDHFDVLFGRTMEEYGWKNYRTEEIKARHYAFSSRSQLPGSDLKAEE